MQASPSSRVSWLGVVLGVAIVVQAALLVGIERPGIDVAIVGLIASALVGLAISRIWSAGWDRPVCSMTLVTLTLGGLGMLCGAVIDDHQATKASVAPIEDDARAPEAALPPCHAAFAEAHAADPEPDAPRSHAWLLSWMNLLMLATCVPACLLLCRCAGLWVHGASGLGMFVGMIAGGAWLGPKLAPWCGPSLAAHLSMLAGMTIGTAIAAAVSLRLTDHLLIPQQSGR